MNNENVEQLLSDCKQELDAINLIIDADKFNSVNQYLTKYCLIKVCGTIEIGFKSIVVDFCAKFRIPQINNYVDKKVKRSSMNANLSNMMSLIGDFDVKWKNDFKKSIEEEPNKDKLKSSLKSLYESRNQFAHGGNPSITINDIVTYYDDAIRILQLLDCIVILGE
ncbi:HEPN domain-containing protein [Clostridium estertheticum]|uniref:HEPN domain-containing protein n=1 Tax=Clostridium estertheticum TaxID=238834 RepID=UPI001CF5BCDB|nr:HEPN domain-containing protein [Clostridium estertheticum]MCB2354711.1 hypothetical protein [Clostridium estertheticum]WAG40953.1 hypothetical protein LL065_22360 [Clostridium estertheticum]